MANIQMGYVTRKKLYHLRMICIGSPPGSFDFSFPDLLFIPEPIRILLKGCLKEIFLIQCFDIKY